MPLLTMLGPILLSFTTSMRDEDVDGLVAFIKDIVAYLEGNKGDICEKS